MHLIRLLHSGIKVLEEGFIPVDVTEMRDQLLAIKRGEVAWDQVDKQRLDLHRKFDATYESSRLPDRPDFEAANRYLIKARRQMVDAD